MPALPVVSARWWEVCSAIQHSDEVSPFLQSCIVRQQAICACSPDTSPKHVRIPETASTQMSTADVNVFTAIPIVNLGLVSVNLSYFF